MVAAAAMYAAACGGSKSPAAPTPPPAIPAASAASLTAPQPSTPVSAQQLDTVRPRLEVKNAGVTGNVGTVKYRFEVSETDSFPEGSRTVVIDDVPQGAGDTTWVDVSVDLIPNFTYSWRAHATNDTLTTDWSKVETFKTQNRGFINGQTVFDPLTNGQTVGVQHGGHFVPGQGWQADGLNDGIDYDIPTCSNCQVEFDVTGFGKGGGVPIDVKWLSMGDANAFGGFLAFRDHLWKMHLEQRADGDGTGMKIIWRNGGAGPGKEPGDHVAINPPNKVGGPTWRDGDVYHFVFRWDSSGFAVTINGDVWFQSGFSGHAYAPPNHRISLGCYPRGETMAGAIWRNVRVSPQ